MLKTVCLQVRVQFPLSATGGAIELADATDLTTSGGAITLSAGNDVTFSGDNTVTVSTGEGAVSVTANSVSIADDSSISTVAGDIGITTVSTLVAADLTTSSGAITLQSSGDAVGLRGQVNTGTGDFTARAAANIALNNSVNLSTSGGSILLDAGNNVQGLGNNTLTVTDGAGSIALAAEGAVIFATNSLNTVEGNITVSADSGISTGAISSTEGDVTIDSENSAVTLGGSISSNGGLLDIDAGTDLTLLTGVDLERTASV